MSLPTNQSTDLTIDFRFIRVATGYTTYTQGGWGAAPHGKNTGTLLKNRFAALYPSDSTIGGMKTLKFTTAAAIEAFCHRAARLAC